jgi:AbrB family looped-hinge helix DNA binding protein
MTRAKITAKGQVTIPKDIRDRLGLRIGDEIDFVPENGVVLLRKIVPDDPFAKWRGYLKDLEGQDVDELIEEMRGR